jgi:GcrA cell cycle regulator
MAWTEERIAKLKQGWESGMTATQIAEMLGEGVTRNAVIGKAHRLGLESRPSPVKATDGAPAPAPRSAAAAPQPPTAPAQAAQSALPPAAASAPAPSTASASLAAPSGTMPAPAAPRPQAKPANAGAKIGKQARTTLLDLSDKVCKWPIGHPGEPDFHFCGKPVNPGFPYCAEHCLVAYQAQMPRRDRPRQLPTIPGAPRR